MALTDYDMQRFAEIISDCRKTAGTDPRWDAPQEAASYFIEDTPQSSSYCMEYGFSSAGELYAMFDRFLPESCCGTQERRQLIRACIAACYKYAAQDTAEDDGQISEFIYEF